MALKLPNFFVAKGILTNIQNFQLSRYDLSTARLALKDDVDAFFVNGLVSLAGSINSLSKENYSWSFIQSYYSIFYFARAFNGINDYAIVYKDKKPWGIKLQPAQGFVKLKGNSHEVVLEQFKEHFSNDALLSSTIENQHPVDWFNNNRNHINYTMNPLPDPYPPIDLYRHYGDLRKWIVTYFADSSHVYTFDPKHCFIAFPLQLFLRIITYYTDNGLSNMYINDKLDYLKRNFCDEKGAITNITSKILDVAP